MAAETSSNRKAKCFRVFIVVVVVFLPLLLRLVVCLSDNRSFVRLSLEKGVCLEYSPHIVLCG